MSDQLALLQKVVRSPQAPNDKLLCHLIMHLHVVDPDGCFTSCHFVPHV